MGVNYRNPGMLLIGAILIAIVCLAAFMLRRRRTDRVRVRVANTSRLKEHPLYKKKLLEARIFRILSVAGIILSLIAALFLTARPYRKDSHKEKIERRDIYLCVDLSSSSYMGVQDLVEEFDRTVDGLNGDRIGISVFNTSSIRYVPMTDDYDFVHDRLKSLAEYLAAEQEFMVSYVDRYDSVYDIPESERSRYEELNKVLSSFDQGITAGYELKGTSAVGEGLASCLFSFPELNQEDRTRLIIFVTDNHEELLDEPLVTLEESAKMCAADHVTVFGIYPGSMLNGQKGQTASIGQVIQLSSQGEGEEDETERSNGGNGSDSAASERNAMKAAVELTGGKLYQSGSSVTAKEILADIEAQEIRNTKTTTATLDTDMPVFWFRILVLGFLILVGTTAFFVLRRGIRKGLFSRKLTAAILLAAMLAAVIVIGVRPMYLSPSTEIMTNNLDVAFVVDTTISMWAEDHDGQTRMEGVKDDISTIMNALPGSNFSLIRFDNGAEIMTPFTQDLEAIRDMIDELDMPAYATARGSSLNTAYEALKAMLQTAGKNGESRRTIVFIFSDGETTDGSSLMSFQDLSSMIDEGAVMGYGTAEGGSMYYPGRGYLRDTATGSEALSRMDEAALQQIADDLHIPCINRTEEIHTFEGLKGSSLSARLYSIRMMSKNAAFADGDRTGYEETYYYFSAFAALLLLIWLFLTIYRGGVA